MDTCAQNTFAVTHDKGVALQVDPRCGRCKRAVHQTGHSKSGTCQHSPNDQRHRERSLFDRPVHHPGMNRESTYRQQTNTDDAIPSTCLHDCRRHFFSKLFTRLQISPHHFVQIWTVANSRRLSGLLSIGSGLLSIGSIAMTCVSGDVARTLRLEQWTNSKPKADPTEQTASHHVKDAKSGL